MKYFIIAVVIIILAVCLVGGFLLIFLAGYTIAQFMREKKAARKEKINWCCHYRLNDYFVINRYINKKSYINMDMALSTALINWGLCLKNHRLSIKEIFVNTLNTLESDLLKWHEKNSDDLYCTTNAVILKRIKKCEKNGIIKIKKETEIRSAVQYIEQLSICNPKHEKKKMYKLIICISNRNEKSD